jgi:hypothetical protein
MYFLFFSRKPYWPTQVYWLTWRSIVDSSRNNSGHLVQMAVFLVCLPCCFNIYYFPFARCVGCIKGNLKENIFIVNMLLSHNLLLC